MADRSTTSIRPPRHERLREAIAECGYYPTVVTEAVEGALAGEPVVDFVLHHEPTFDRDDEVRRHVTVVVLTTTRLVVETPQYFLLRVACGLARTPGEAIGFYRLMSSLAYLPSSPTLFNSGTRHTQMSSCYLVDSPRDELDSIYARYQQVYGQATDDRRGLPAE